MGPNANEFAGVINNVITQEIQSNSTLCVNQVNTSNSISEKAIGSNCNQVSGITSKNVYTFNTTCYNNSKMLGSTTNNITNSIMSQLQQNASGTFPPNANANLKDGIINIVNTFITQETLTAIVNSITTDNTTTQLCYDSSANQLAFISEESFASAVSKAVSQNAAVMQASTAISNYITQSLSQKTKGTGVAFMQTLVIILIVGLVIFVVVAVVALIIMKKFM